jgi:hypothetical protein
VGGRWRKERKEGRKGEKEGEKEGGSLSSVQTTSKTLDKAPRNRSEQYALMREGNFTYLFIIYVLNL